jgi:hypothetical protein
MAGHESLHASSNHISLHMDNYIDGVFQSFLHYELSIWTNRKKAKLNQNMPFSFQTFNAIVQDY